MGMPITSTALAIIEVENIRFIAITAEDPQLAADLENDLFERVVLGIASGACRDPIAVASEALKVKDIPFERGLR